MDGWMDGWMIVGSGSEYVISLKAFNNLGQGRPIYETIQTREEQEPIG